MGYLPYIKRLAGFLNHQQQYDWMSAGHGFFPTGFHSPLSDKIAKESICFRAHETMMGAVLEEKLVGWSVGFLERDGFVDFFFTPDN